MRKQHGIVVMDHLVNPSNSSVECFEKYMCVGKITYARPCQNVFGLPVIGLNLQKRKKFIDILTRR